VSAQDGDRTGSFPVGPPARPIPGPDAGQLLQQYVNKRSFLPGRALTPGVHGVMDTSIEYPVRRRPVQTVFAAGVGLNVVELAAPGPDQHMVVYYGFFQAIGANPILEAALWTQSDETAGAGMATAPTAIPLLWGVPVTIVTLRRLFPLVGAEVSSGTSTVQGVKSVYLPYPTSLWLGFDSGLGGQNCLTYTNSLTLPDTQPFSSILAL
jgi:hypothetical protein